MSDVESIAPRERARSARREALLETAEQVFAERGFAGATMAEIAARGGYSAGNLYNVFESKEALFQEVCREATELLHEQQRALLRSGVPFITMLDQQTEQVVTFCIEHRRFFVIYVRTTAGVGFNAETFGEETLRMERETEGVLRERIERAMEACEIEKNDPEAVASLISGSFHRLIVHWIQNEGSPDALRTNARSLTELLRRALTPGGIPV
jgi:AcrR family transcriptional regulator